MRDLRLIPTLLGLVRPARAVCQKQRQTGSLCSIAPDDVVAGATDETRDQPFRDVVGGWIFRL
jgi:hypothetical protein